MKQKSQDKAFPESYLSVIEVIYRIVFILWLIFIFKNYYMLNISSLYYFKSKINSLTLIRHNINFYLLFHRKL